MSVDYKFGTVFGGGGLLDFGQGTQNFFAGLQDAGAALDGRQGNALDRLRQSRMQQMQLERGGDTPLVQNAPATAPANSTGGGGLLDFGSRFQNVMAGLQDAGAALQGRQGSALDRLRQRRLEQTRLRPGGNQTVVVTQNGSGRPQPRQITREEERDELRNEGASFRADLPPEEWIPAYTKLFNDPKVFDEYRAQVKQVYDRSAKTGLEESIIRVYQAPDGRVKSAIVPGTVAEKGVGVTPPPWDSNLGTLLFEGHPHPSGDLARASPKDLGTSLKSGGIPSVIWYKTEGGTEEDRQKKTIKEYWYKGRPRD